MLILRQRQWDALREGLKESYLPELVAYLRREHAENLEGASAAEVEALVLASIAKAGSFGLHDLYDVQVYLQCVAWLGEGFEERHAWARPILEDEARPAEEKVLALEGAAMEHLAGEEA